MLDDHGGCLNLGPAFRHSDINAAYGAALRPRPILQVVNKAGDRPPIVD